MDIRNIQDYSQRFGRTPLNFEKKPFSTNEVDLEGRVSSSEIRIPMDIRSETDKDPYRKKLFDASVEFESIFVKMMLKEMKASVHKEKLIDGGYAEEIFEDMLYDEYAKNISKNESLGLAEEIYRQMSVSLPRLSDLAETQTKSRSYSNVLPQNPLP